MGQRDDAVRNWPKSRLYQWLSKSTVLGGLSPGQRYRLVHGSRLVKVMGHYRSSSDVQFLDVFCAKMDDLVDVLQRAFDQQEFRIGDEVAVGFVEIGIDDSVGDASLILK